MSQRTSERCAFGPLLREHRLAASLSQETLAERARLSVAAVAAMERGRIAVPRPGTVLLLSKALRLTSQQRTAFIDAARGVSARRNVVSAAARTASVACLPHNLPPSLTRLVGRCHAVAE